MITDVEIYPHRITHSIMLDELDNFMIMVNELS